MVPTALRAAAVAALVITTTSCSQGAGTATPEPEPPDEPWDLLYISDSSAWGVPTLVGELASEDLGRDVRVVNWQVPNLAMHKAHDMVDLRPEVVAEAEIVVLWGNPTDVGVKPGWEHCMRATGDPGPYTAEDYAPFAEELGATLDAIWAARDGQPTVVRVTDIYVPNYADLRAAGVYDACRAVFDAMSAAVRDAAEAHGATFVSVYDAYNGVDRDEDPVDKGYIGGDGIHPSDAGSRAAAVALAGAGFEPTTP